MNKNILKYGLYVCIIFILVVVLFIILKFNESFFNKIENFTAIDELEKLKNLQKYNLLASDSMNIFENIYSITLPKNYFIKQIYIVVEDEEIDSEVKRKSYIPIDLEIIVINNGNEKYINMNNYKLSSSSQIYYPGKSLDILNITDNNDNFVNGNKIIFKSESQNFKFSNILIFGNDNGSKYIELINETDITSNIKIINGNLTSSIPYLISNIEFNTVGNISLYLKNNGTIFKTYNILLDDYIKKYYFNNPILINEETLSVYFSDDFSDAQITAIYGKKASSADIQNFRFTYGLISFRDSLNPDTILGEKELIDKIDKSTEILDVLDYQKKINSQLKQLDLNKKNIRDLYNQKQEVIETINKIDRISNTYLKLIKDTDEYNAKKFTETIELLQYLKNSLEQRLKLQKVNFDFNLIL
jgi:hypothetical protein